MIQILIIAYTKTLKNKLNQALSQADEIEILAETEDGQEGVKLFKEAKPDLLLVELDIPGISGIEVTRRINQHNKKSKIMIFSKHIMPPYSKKLFDMGASAFIAMDEDQSEILKAIQTIQTGKKYLSPKVIQTEDLQKKSDLAKNPFASLTNREFQTIHNLIHEKSMEQIANNFNVDLRTIQKHRETAFKKLGVSTEFSLFKKALNYKLIVGSELDNILPSHSFMLSYQIVQKTPVNLYWKDETGEYIFCNKFMLKEAGLEKNSDIVGKTDRDLWPDNADKLRAVDLKVMRTNKTITAEETVKTHDGQVHIFKSIKSPWHDENGKVIGIVGASMEITDLKSLKKTHKH